MAIILKFRAKKTHKKLFSTTRSAFNTSASLAFISPPKKCIAHDHDLFRLITDDQSPLPLKQNVAILFLQVFGTSFQTENHHVEGLEKVCQNQRNRMVQNYIFSVSISPPQSVSHGSISKVSKKHKYIYIYTHIFHLVGGENRSFEPFTVTS